jgi:DNA-binding phage protein
MSDESASAETIRKLRALVAEHGEAETAKKLQITRQTIARALAGLPLRSTTRFLLKEKLK